MGPIIQHGPMCNVPQERAQCRWQAVCQKKEGGREVGGIHQEKPMIGRKTDNGTSQSREPTANRTKPGLLRQQGVARRALDMDLKNQEKETEGEWNADLEPPPTLH